jgi:hypothetical protein
MAEVVEVDMVEVDGLGALNAGTAGMRRGRLLG